MKKNINKNEKTLSKSKTKYLLSAAVGTSVIAGAAAPTIMLIQTNKDIEKAKQDRTIYEILHDAVERVEVVTHPEGDGSVNQVTVHDYDEMVINSANWIPFDKSQAEDIAFKMNLKKFVIPENINDEIVTLHYKVTADTSVQRSPMYRKKYLLHIKATNGLTEVSKVDQYQMYSYDLYDSTIGNSEEGKITLVAWIQTFNDNLVAKTDWTYETLQAKVTDEFTAIPDDAQVETFNSLGFDNVEQALAVFPYANNGTKVKLWYKFERSQSTEDKNIEGYQAEYQLSLKAKYPTTDGNFAEFDNQTIEENGIAQPNNSRARVSSADNIPHSALDNEKLKSFVERVNYSLYSPQTAPTVKELERKVKGDWLPVEHIDTLLDLGYVSNTLEDVWSKKHPDLKLAYKFERQYYVPGEAAKYVLKLKGNFVDDNTSLEYIFGDRVITSSNAVSIDPTTQESLTEYITEVNSKLIASTDKIISWLDRNVNPQFTTFTNESTINALGFSGIDLGSKPLDITLWYKFDKTTAEEGKRAIYTLSLRGTVTENEIIKHDFTISTKTITSMDAIPVPLRPSTQEQLEEYVNYINEPLVASEDKTIEYLDSKIRPTYTTLASSSQLEGLGFTGANLGDKPRDVTLSYKFVRLAAEIGEKPTYQLFIRGVTSGVNDTPSLSFVVSDKTIVAADEIQAPASPTSQAMLEAYMRTLFAIPSAELTFSELDQMIQTSKMSFDIEVFRALGFVNISMGNKPADVVLEFTFEPIKREEGVNAVYRLTIFARTTHGLEVTKLYDVTSTDAYLNPTSAELLKYYVDGITMLDPSNFTVIQLEDLLVPTAQDWDTDTFNEYNIRFNSAIIKPADVYFKYKFERLKYVDKQKAEYTFSLIVNTRSGYLVPLVKTLKIVSADDVDLPSTDEELVRYLRTITYALPIAKFSDLNSFLEFQKQELTESEMLAIGFTNVNFGNKLSDVELHYTFKLKSSVDKQRAVFTLTIFATTYLGNEASIEIDVQSSDIMDYATTQEELQKYLDGINGTAPSYNSTKLETLVKDRWTAFDRIAFESILGFTGVSFAAKESDVTLTYTLLKGEVTDGQPIPYILTIKGETTSGLSATADIIINSTDLYDTPTEQADLDTLIASMQLNGIALTIAELNTMTTYEKEFSNFVVQQFGLNIDLTQIPLDVKLTYTFAKGTIAAPSYSQTYVLTVYGKVKGLTTAQKAQNVLSTDLVTNAQVDVANEVSRFVSEFGWERNETTITRVPEMRVHADLSLISSQTFNKSPNHLLSVKYEIVSVLFSKAVLKTTFTVGTYSESVNILFSYTKIQEEFDRDEANLNVNNAKIALHAFNNSISSLRFDVLDNATSTTLKYYTYDLGLPEDERLSRVDAIAFTMTHNANDYSTHVRAVISTANTSLTGNDLVVEFVIYSSDRANELADQKINAAKTDIATWGTEYVSMHVWATLAAAASESNKDNYDLILGLTKFNSVKALDSATFTTVDSTSQFTKTLTIILFVEGTSLSLRDRTIQIELEAINKESLIANAKVDAVKAALNAFNNAISTKNWAQLQLVAFANKNNYSTEFGLNVNTAIDQATSVSFRAQNNSGANAYTKTVTATIIVDGTSYNSDELIVVFVVVSKDRMAQVADNKIRTAMDALNKISYTSTLNWSELKDLTAVSKARYAELLGLESKDEVMAVENVLFTLSDSTQFHVKQVVIVLHETGTTMSEYSRTLFKFLIANDKAELDQAAIDNTVLAAINVLKAYTGVSTRNWAQLQTALFATKENYASYFGISASQEVYAMQTVTFTASNSTSSYSKLVRAVITMPGTSYTTELTVEFTLSASDKDILDANDKVLAAREELERIATTSALNWAAIKDVTAADKTNFHTLLGIASNSRLTAVDNLLFVVTNVSGKNNKYTKRLNITIVMENNSLSSSVLNYEVIISAKDKATLDAQDIANASQSRVNAAKEGFDSFDQTVSSKTWKLLQVMIGTSALNKYDYASMLGFTADGIAENAIMEVAAVTFTISQVTKYTLTIRASISDGTVNAISTFVIISKDKAELDASDDLDAAIVYMNTLTSNGNVASTLNWNTLKDVIGANQSNYDTQVGLAKSEILDKIDSIEITLSNGIKDYTKEVKLVLNNQWTNVDEAHRTFVFNMQPSDYQALLTVRDNGFINEAKAQLTNLNRRVSTFAWSSLKGVNSLDRDNLWSKLGINKPSDADNKLLKLQSSSAFTVRTIDAAEYTLTIQAVLAIENTSLSAAERTVSFEIYAQDRNQMVADRTVNLVLTNLAALPKKSTKNWADLSTVSFTTMSGYRNDLGIQEIGGLMQLSDVVFIIRHSTDSLYVLDVKLILGADDSTLTEEQRTFTLNLEANDKLDKEKNESENKVARAKMALDAISATPSTKTWSEINNLTAFDKSNFWTVLGLSITAEQRKDIDAVDSISFVHYHSTNSTYTLSVKATITMEGATSSGSTKDFEVIASDKGLLEADEVVAQAKLDFATFTKTTATWEALNAYSSATKDNFEARLGLKSTKAIDLLTTISFSWTVKSQADYSIEVTISYTKEHSTVETPNYVFELVAFDKNALTQKEANAKVEAALTYLRTLNNATSTKTWSEIQNISNANKNTFFNLFGLTSNISVDNVTAVNFVITTTGAAGTPNSYRKTVVATVSQTGSSISGAAAQATFIITSSNKVSLDANDIVNDAKAELTRVFGNSSVNSSQSWSALQNVTTANKNNYATVLGVTSDTSKVSLLNALNVTLINKPNTPYVKVVTIKIVMNNTSYDGSTVSYTFDLNSKDKAVLEANDKLANIMKELATFGGDSTRAWDGGLATLAVGSTSNISNYASLYGIPSNAVVNTANAVSFIVLENSNYTLKIRATVTVANVSDSNNTHTFSVYAQDKLTKDANNRILAAKAALQAMTTNNISTLQWSTLRDKTHADKTNYATVFGISSSPAVAALQAAIFSVAQLAPDLDEYGMDRNAYTLPIRVVLNETYTTLSDEDRIVSFQLFASNSKSLIANDKILKVKEGLAKITNTSSRTYADLTPVTSATKSNYNTQLGVTKQKETDLADSIAFTVVRLHTPGNTNTTYVFDVTASISVQHSTLPSGETWFNFRLRSSDKVQLDIRDVLREERDRINAFGTKVATASNARTTLASRFAFAGGTTTNATSFMSAADWGTPRASTLTTFTVNGGNNSNGTVTIRATISSTDPQANASTTETANFTLSGFMTAQEVVNDAHNKFIQMMRYEGSWYYYASLRTFDQITNMPAAVGDRRIEDLLGRSNTDINRHISEHGLKVWYDSVPLYTGGGGGTWGMYLSPRVYFSHADASTRQDLEIWIETVDRNDWMINKSVEAMRFDFQNSWTILNADTLWNKIAASGNKITNSSTGSGTINEGTWFRDEFHSGINSDPTNKTSANSIHSLGVALGGGNSNLNDKNVIRDQYIWQMAWYRNAHSYHRNINVEWNVVKRTQNKENFHLLQIRFSAEGATTVIKQYWLHGGGTTTNEDTVVANRNRWMVDKTLEQFNYSSSDFGNRYTYFRKEIMWPKMLEVGAGFSPNSSGTGYVWDGNWYKESYGDSIQNTIADISSPQSTSSLGTAVGGNNTNSSDPNYQTGKYQWEMQWFRRAHMYHHDIDVHWNIVRRYSEWDNWQFLQLKFGATGVTSSIRQYWIKGN